MEIVQVDINKLKTAEYNPRKWDKKTISDIKTSIKRFGIVDPIIANSAPGRENIVIGGHLRLHACKELRYKEVPVFYVNIPDVQKEKELNLRLNKNTGEFDYDKLLLYFDKGLLEDVGFEKGELNIGNILVITDDEMIKTGSNYFDAVAKNTSWIEVGSVGEAVVAEVLNAVEEKLKEKIDDEYVTMPVAVYFAGDKVKMKEEDEGRKYISIKRISGKVSKSLIEQVEKKIQEKKEKQEKVLTEMLEFVLREWK